MTRKELAELAFKECCDEKTTVKYGTKGGFPFWNTEATMFMYVPAFHFTGLKGISNYRYDATDEKGVTHSFVAGGCCELLTPIWAELPEGVVNLKVTALNRDGSDCALVGARTFYRSAPFPEETPAAKCTYKECAIKAIEYAFTQPFMQYWLREGKPDPGYDLNIYPAKMISALGDAMVSYAKLCPEKADIALKIATNAADFLISITPRGDKPLADLPLTYYLDFCPDPEAYNILTPNWYAAKSRCHLQMMIYPTYAGRMYINLYRATNDRKYLDEAVKIGKYYLRTVESNGSWFLLRSIETGEPVSKNYISPIDSVTPFLFGLYEVTGEKCWKDLAEGTVRYVFDNQLSVYNWEGQFEDSPLSVSYTNLSHYSPVFLAEYLLKAHPDDPKSKETAMELMRYVEDQFVIWKRPYPWSQSSPTGELYDNSIWHTPAGLEQYNWYVPIDASTATILEGFLALYKAGCGSLYLAKAKALADQITVMQHENGQIPTHWMNTEDAEKNFWFNCMFRTVNVLEKISEYQDTEP